MFLNNDLYDRKLWYQHLIFFFQLQNNLGDFKTFKHKFKSLFCTLTLGLKILKYKYKSDSNLAIRLKSKNFSQTMQNFNFK